MLGLTVKVRSLIISLAFAVTVTRWAALTSPSFSANVALALPAGIVMRLTAVSATAGWLVVSVTTMGPGAAGLSSVTVPVRARSGPAEDAVTETEAAPMGRTAIFWVSVAPFAVAVIVPACSAATAWVVIAKLLLVSPALMVMLPGTV